MRQAWINSGKFVELNPEKAAKWDAKYGAKNQIRLAKYTSGESKTISWNPASAE